MTETRPPILPGTGSDLPTGAQFYRSAVILNSWMSVPALAIVISCLAALLRLTSEQWGWFARITVIYAIVAVPITMRFQYWLTRDVMRWLDDRRDSRDAFRAVMVWPLRAGVVGAVSWVLPVVLVSIGMRLRYPSWGWMETCAMLIAGVAAGFVVGSLIGYRVKDLARPVREALAAEIPDPAERAGLTFSISLRAKLLTTISLVTLVPVVFSRWFLEITSRLSKAPPAR